MSLIRSAFRILLLLALVAVATSIWLYFDYSRFRDAALTLSDDTPPLEVARGTSLQGIVAEIDGRGLSNAPRPYWRALAWELRVSTRLHAGEYALEPGLSPRELLLRMARGQVIQHNFTIVPGWTFRDLREALAHEPLLNVTLKGLSDRDAMAKIGAPALAPEGRFLPETYAFVKNEDDVEILQSAYHAMEAELARAWEKREPDLAIDDPALALTLASIVEKETARANERPQIAGVFERRLKLGMKLQTDPTVIYGLGAAFDGNLTRAQLELDTPFNTYTRTGLPPTPIALPGKEALSAVLHPGRDNALYFVAKGDGSHAFSATLAEHNAAVSRYQLHR